MKAEWIFVDTAKKLQRAREEVDGASLLSIDTEYDSFRYFREKLCLVQIHTDSTTFVFDPLLDKLNLAFLCKSFGNPAVVKILHAADNDIRLLKRDYGCEFINIFDTHRAALLLGFKQLSLEKMIKEFLDVELEKSKKVQRSRWDKRPLSEEQLHYAALDVQYLPALYEKQLARLKENNMLKAAGEAFAKIAAAVWQERKIDRRGYARLHSYYALNQEQKDLLKKLYTWRFSRAREEDCAIFMFLPDEVLAEIVLQRQDIQVILSVEKYKLFGRDIEKIIGENQK